MCTATSEGYGQDSDSLQVILESIREQIMRQKPVSSASGTKSGWVFEYNGCSCQYKKSQSYSAGSYALIEWEINFDLKDIRSASIGPYNDRALILETVGEQALVNTLQQKTYRDHELEVNNIREKTVVIDLANRTSATKLAESFEKAIAICTARE